MTKTDKNANEHHCFQSFYCASFTNELCMESGGGFQYKYILVFYR